MVDVEVMVIGKTCNGLHGNGLCRSSYVELVILEVRSIVKEATGTTEKCSSLPARRSISSGLDLKKTSCKFSRRSKPWLESCLYQVPRPSPQCRTVRRTRTLCNALNSEGDTPSAPLHSESVQPCLGFRSSPSDWPRRPLSTSDVA